MKSIGIDIGSYSIKIAELSLSKKGITVHALEEHILGQNPAFDNDLEILEVLRGLLLRHDPSNVKFVVGLRQDFVTGRLKVFPFQDRLKISKSLPFELEEETPFSSENAIFDYKSIRMSGAMSEILAFMAPKSKVKEMLDKLDSFNFPVQILSAESMGITNLIEQWQEAAPTSEESIDPEDLERPRRPLRMLLQFGHLHTNIMAFAGDRLAGCRTVLMGMKGVAEALSKRYEIPLQNALAELTTKGFLLPSKEGASYDQIIFSDTILAAVKDIAHDLRMAMLEMQTELYGDFVSAEVSGGGALLSNLCPYLTTQLEIPCNPFEWKHTLQIDAPLSPHLESVGGGAVGLAIEAYKKPRNPAINFRRAEFALQNKAGHIFWETWGGSIRFAAGVFVVFFLYSYIRDSLAYNLAEITYETLRDQAKTVAGIAPKQANEAGVRKYIKGEKDRIRETESLLGVMKMNSAVEILKSISDAMPGRDVANIQVRKLFIEDDSVVLEGTLKQSGALPLIEEALKTISLDGKIQSSPGGTTAEGQSFSLRFRVQRNVVKVVKK